MTVVTPGDLDILARTLFGEARGEPYAGKKAVVHVIRNRRDKAVGDRDHSLAAAALRWRQFSTWNENDPNRDIIETVGVNSREFRDCLRAVLEALDERDPTQGATHYHTKFISPAWSRGRTPVLEIGNHVFFNDID